MNVSIWTNDEEDALVAVVANARGLIDWIDIWGMDNCGPEGGRDAWIRGLRTSLDGLKAAMEDR